MFKVGDRVVYDGSASSLADAKKGDTAVAHFDSGDMVVVRWDSGSRKGQLDELYTWRFSLPVPHTDTEGAAAYYEALVGFDG